MGGHRSREEIILHFLQLPLKNITSVHVFDQDDAENKNTLNRYSIEKLAQDEPSVFADYSNPLLQHVAIFKSLLDRYNQDKPLPKP